MSAETRSIPIGATKELSLRVSVATLVRVLFQPPKEGSLMLALERRATLREQAGEGQVLLKCQPFGGAVRFRNLDPLKRLINDFHFDSESSRSERDFRIFIRPADWNAVKEFCRLHLENGNDSILESGPERELVEEFSEAIGIHLSSQQYTSRPLGTVIEDHPAATENVHAWGYQTARVYRIFEAHILDPALCVKMLENSERCSNEDQRARALTDARQGGNGWANAILALPMEQLLEFYLALSPGLRAAPVWYWNNFLDENVCAILEGVIAPRYRSLR
jgi:hypothetical protein